MDESNTGMDREVKLYFRKILNSVSIGASWLLLMATLGLFFKLALVRDRMEWYNIAFYVFFLLTLAWLLRYFYRLWKR